MTKNIYGNLIAFISVVFFSTYSIFSKLLLEHFSSQTLAAISQGLSVVALLFIFGMIPELKKIHHLPIKKIAFLIIISFLSAIIAPLLFLKGLEYTTATNGVLLSRLQSIMIGIISAIWLKEKITRHQVIGMIVMILGIYIIANKGLSIQAQFNNGDIMIILAAFSWALSVSIFKKYLHKISPELVVIFRNTVGALVLFFILPYILGFQHNFQSLSELNVVKLLIIFSIIAIMACQFLWYKSLKIISATRASTISLLSPFFGVIFAVLILGEKLAIYHLYGGILVIIGLVLTVIHHQKHPHHHIHQKVKHHLH